MRKLLIKKIAIIGSPGAGKTTLATELGKTLNIKVFHLDRLLWKRGWIRKCKDTRIDILYKIVPERQWIIEGTYLSSSKPRLEEADTIIFLDMPPWLCLLRIIRRHRKNRGMPRRDLPMDSADKLTLSRMLKVLTFALAERERLQRVLNKYESERVVRLCSHKAVKNFLKEQMPKIDAHGASSGVRSFQKIFSLTK
ncbi:MAG: hypothetical protein JO031_16750 [Ktedonobacteraceae bacterium]|nr:hypothetical protein [Ktedonobacteraceae bacterium]